ncbi:MAG: hypothetical protein Q8J66_02405 [Methylotenera sp.]|nr:hypothetical protein [Methylotenera sp.]
MKPLLLSVTTSVLLCNAQLTLAATMYLCGSSFQDTPCANQNYSKTMKAAKASDGATKDRNLSPYQVDADCKQRGDTAKKMMWLRQTGKTKEEQLAKEEPLDGTENAQNQALVHEVYNNRDTVLEVKNIIEQSCMQQKEQNKLAEELLIEAKRLKKPPYAPAGKVTSE